MTYRRPQWQNGINSSNSTGVVGLTVAVKRSLPYSPMKARKRERSEVRQNVQQKAMKAITDIHKSSQDVLVKAATAAASLSTTGSAPKVEKNKSAPLSRKDQKKRATTNEPTETATIESYASFHLNNNTVSSSAASQDIYKPAVIFPYSNDPYLKRQSKKKQMPSVAENRKQWESLFDSQYSFGSFVHGIPKPKPTYEYFYKGQWPLTKEDILGMIPNTTSGKGSRLDKEVTAVQAATKQLASDTDNPGSLEPSSSSTLSASKDGKNDNGVGFFFSPVPEPKLPDMKQLQRHINRNNKGSLHQHNSGSQHCSLAKTASDEGVTYYDASELTSVEEEQLWKDRLKLLKKLQQEGFHEKWNGTKYDPYLSTSRAARIQQQLKTQALKLKQHATKMPAATVELTEIDPLSSSTSAMDAASIINTDRSQESNNNSSLSMSQRPPFSSDNNSSIITLDDQWEEISFTTGGKEKTHTCQPESSSPKSRARFSFLLFALGFVCPPLWIVGALYTPSSDTSTTAVVIMAEKTTTVQDYNRKIDQKWKRYSKNAFLLFLLIAAAALIFTLAFNPEVMGYRKSSEQGYQGQRVHFDDSAASTTFR